APGRAPRIPDDKQVCRVVVADGEHGVPPDRALAILGYDDVAGLGRIIAEDALVAGEAEDERKAFGQATAHLAVVLHEPVIGDRLILLRRLITCGRGLLDRVLVVALRREGVRVVWPQRFRTGALTVHALDPIADHRAGIRVHTAFHRALIVVDEQTRRHEVRRLTFLHAVELDRRADGVSRAGTDATLVVDGRAMLAQIDLGRQLQQDRRRRGVKMIAPVGQVRNPA